CERLLFWWRLSSRTCSGPDGEPLSNAFSVASRRGLANAAAYCASKFGLTGSTPALAAQGKPVESALASFVRAGWLRVGLLPSPKRRRRQTQKPCYGSQLFWRTIIQRSLKD